MYTIVRCDLLSVAGEIDSPFFGVYVQLLCAWSEVFHKLAKVSGRDSPAISRLLSIKQNMHRHRRLKCKAIALEHTCDALALLNTKGVWQCYHVGKSFLL